MGLQHQSLGKIQMWWTGSPTHHAYSLSFHPSSLPSTGESPQEFDMTVADSRLLSPEMFSARASSWGSFLCWACFWSIQTFILEALVTMPLSISRCSSCLFTVMAESGCAKRCSRASPECQAYYSPPPLCGSSTFSSHHSYPPSWQEEPNLKRWQP